MPYHDSSPTAAGFKASGTSAEAAQSARLTVKIIRARIIGYMRQNPRPVSADECAEAIGMSILSVRPRFSEMHKDGVIRDSGERGINASGRSCNLWRLTSSTEAAQ